MTSCYLPALLAGGLLHDCVCALPRLRAVCLVLTSADGARLHACQHRQGCCAGHRMADAFLNSISRFLLQQTLMTYPGQRVEGCALLKLYRLWPSRKCKPSRLRHRPVACTGCIFPRNKQAVHICRTGRHNQGVA